jgi:hemerythrin-like domain-containing protein
MLRDHNLIPLSRQHQHALALCVRLDRAIQAGGLDLETWQAEIQDQFDQEVSVHFAAEEQALFPVARQMAELRATVDELRAEHDALRQLFARAAQRSLELSSLADFVERLARHIRKEERELFEGMQKVMTPAQLSELGAALNEALKPAITSCSLPRKPGPEAG